MHRSTMAVKFHIYKSSNSVKLGQTPKGNHTYYNNRQSEAIFDAIILVMRWMSDKMHLSDAMNIISGHVAYYQPLFRAYIYSYVVISPCYSISYKLLTDISLFIFIFSNFKPYLTSRHTQLEYEINVFNTIIMRFVAENIISKE